MTLLQWQTNFDLTQLNTMGVPCEAEYFTEVSTDAELVNSIKLAKKQQVAVNILGGGSNILCAPRISGLVLRPLFMGVVVEENGVDVLLTVGAGENWHSLVLNSLGKGYFGLENLALIPGCVGAAPIQNIGAYGVELAERLVSVRWYNMEDEAFKTYSAADCQLGYRDSIFKRGLKNWAIITHITLKLSKLPKAVIHYQSLADYFAQTSIAPNPSSVFEVVCQQRQSKLPDPKNIPNSGSFFKNPVISVAKFKDLQQQFPTMPFYDQGNQFVKIPAAWLIDQVGLKGQLIDGLVIHDRQALVLTNPNHMSLESILSASQKIADIVSQKFDICLEREPQIFE